MVHIKKKKKKTLKKEKKKNILEVPRTLGAVDEVIWFKI